MSLNNFTKHGAKQTRASTKLLISYKGNILRVIRQQST